MTQELGDPYFEARATGNLGYALLSRGRKAEALVLFERALQMAVDLGYRQGEAKAAGNLGLVWADEGRLAKALPLYDRCIEISREIGSRQTEATATGDRATACRQLGRLEEARANFARELQIGGSYAGTAGRIGMGACAVDEAKLEEAERWCREALTHARSVEDPLSTSAALVALGGLLSDTERGAEAVPLLEEAASLAHAYDAPDTELLALCHRALVPGGSPVDAEAFLKVNAERLGHTRRMSANYLLARATQASSHLDEAKRLFDHLVEHAPAEDRATMRKNAVLRQDISSHIS